MFKAGETYNVYLLSGGVREFKCTEVNGMKVKGNYKGGKEKVYRAEPRWGRAIDRINGLKPDTFAIEVEKRVGTVCISKDVRKGAN